jgi:hypothetical protein
MNRSGADAAAAGEMMLASLRACAAVGSGTRWPVGLAVPLGLAGLFAGPGVGMALVYARPRRV